MSDPYIKTMSFYTTVYSIQGSTSILGKGIMNIRGDRGGSRKVNVMRIRWIDRTDL